MPLIKLNQEQLRELQLKELDTLLFFKEFCEKNGLTFFLCGGCCIGALRNKGFIPWDDDIDVLMLRPDYEQFLRLWNEQKTSERFVLLNTDDNTFTGNIFATIVDTNYTCVKENQANLNVPHGLVMDIFPVDGCPDGKIKRYIQYFWTLIYSLFLAQIVPENHGGIVGFGSRLLLNLVKSQKARTRIWKYAQKQMSKHHIDDCNYVTELCAGPHFMKYKYPKRIYSGTTNVEFEGHQMPIPVGYDEYLTIAFGNYMDLPPEDDRIPHHDLVELDLNKPCK